MSAGYMRRCARKKPFASQDAANDGRTALQAAKGVKPGALTVYLCDQCLRWHVGGSGGVYISRNRRSGKRANKNRRGR